MRIFADIIIFLCIFLTPWYIPLILSLFLLVYFDYIEIVFVGAMIDALYGGKMFVLLGTVVFIGFIFLKPRLAFYS